MAIDFLGQTRSQRNPYLPLQGMWTRPIIFLGLGGVGSAAVSKLKSLFLRTFAPHMEEGKESPIPTGIQFLCFDSAASEKPSNLALDDEWTQMVARASGEALRNWRREEFYAAWLPAISGHDYATGAAGKRALGRLLFTRNISNFHQKFSGKLQKATSYPDLNYPTPLVCVFASLAGGTGSGSLLDACFYIRRHHPTAVIYGFLGVVGGLPNLDMTMQSHAHVGAYVALKEIDGFMADKRLQGEYAPGRVFNYPAGGALQGKYDRPFNECFLVSRQNARGVNNLANGNMLSSHLARCAFMLTAYTTVSQNGQRSWEAEMCDLRGHLGGMTKGALACYTVPAVAQLHIPREETADYLCCRLAEKCLATLGGGSAHPDEKAQELIDGHGLRLNALADRVGRRADGSPVEPYNWSARLPSEIDDKKFRYSKAGKAQIVSYGETMATPVRAAQYEQEMAAQTSKLTERAKSEILDAVTAALKTSEYRLVGATDLLDDLTHLIREEIAKGQPASSTIEATASSWSNLKPLIDDVCTKDLFDRFKLPKARELYSSFLDQSDRAILHSQREEQARTVLRNLLEYMKDLNSDLESLARVLNDARKVVSAETDNLAKELHVETQGMAESVDDICSFSMLDANWRKKFLGEEHYRPDVVLDRLSIGDWNPMRWTSLLGQDRPDAQVAQDICNRIDQTLLNRVRQMDIDAVFDLGDDTAERLGEVINKHGSPQMSVQGMVDFLNTPPTRVNLVGGISDDLARRLKDTPGFQALARAVSCEEGKVSYLATFFPVALAGCDRVVGEFHPTYVEWRRELETRPKQERELELRSYHCFAGSTDWQDPAHYYQPVSEEADLFGRCFALSVILDPKRLGPDHDSFPTLSQALTQLSTAFKSPKNMGLGLFRIGKQDFWLVPYFDVSSPANLRQPIKLGTRLSKARAGLLTVDGALNETRRWVGWFDDHWADFFTTDELRRAIDAAIGAARAIHRAQISQSEDDQQWSDVIGVLEAWKEDKTGN